MSMSSTRRFKIPLLQVLLALSLASGFLLIPNTTTAQLGVQILSTSPYTCTNGYNPVTDLQRLAGTTLISGLKVPAGATYACALFGGGGYQFFDDKAKFLGQGVGGFGKDTGNMDESGKIIPTAATCSGITGFFATPATCIGRTLSVVIGAAVISATAWLLAAAGLLFNTLVDHTIITFGYLFTAKVGEAIGLAWSAFRDIANIVIIGMFVFIAINMILGVKEFGEKKKVARVLIIAVLLNFSLLFTKVIIDASNFTALQFYKASQLSTEGEGSGQLLDVAAFSKKGISGEFIRLLGLDSLKETSNALSAAAFGNATNQYATANGWMALLHGLVSATLLLAAALVLLYGCFLIASRAILLILLMVTSALAFASWLIPQQYVEGGFAKWWESLLKATFFAPILMALLWMALLIARAIKPEQGALGHLVGNPTGTLDLNALFSYVIIIGLLFVVFKAAGEFSHSISGFAAVANGLKLAGLAAGVAAPALAWRFGAAPVLRQTVGRGAYYARDSILGEGKKARTRAGELRQLALEHEKLGNIDDAEKYRREAEKHERSAGRYATWAGRAKGISESGFNLGDAGLARQLAKAAGISELAAGQRPKDAEIGFHQAIASRVAIGEERAKALEPSAAERQKMMETERQRIAGERGKTEEMAGFKQRHETAKTRHDEEKTRVDRDEGGHIATARRNLNDITRETEREKEAVHKIAREEIAALQGQLAGAGTEEARQAIREQIKQRSQKREADIAVHDGKVTDAKGLVNALLEPLQKTEKDLSDAAAGIENYNKQTDKLAGDAGRKKYRAAQEGTVGAAEVMGRRSAGVFFKITGDSGHIGAEVAKKVRKGIGTGQQLRSALSEMLDAGGGGAAPSAPAADETV